MDPQPAIIFLITEDWCFLTHRFELALSMKDAGWRVIVATQVNSDADRRRIEAAGLEVVPLPLQRARLLAPTDLIYWWRLVRLYRRVRPAVVHHVAMKPVFYGSLAALLVPDVAVVNAIAGLGFLFSHSSAPVRVVRRIVTWTFRQLFCRAHTCLILQNHDDYDFFTSLGIPPSKLRLIRGAGVNLNQFRPAIHDQNRPPVVVLAARMLRDKGVPELIEASRLLKQAGVPVRVILAGGVDPQNPKSLTREELQAAQSEGAVEWIGHQSDMAAIYSRADIAALPTNYREGVPKTLLEAAACALPIVASDSAGCREIVREGVNGFLVPLRDPDALAQALEKLLRNPDLREQMGRAGLEIARQEFAHTLVISQTHAVYAGLTPLLSLQT